MEIPLDVLKLVATYLVKQKMKLLDWIPIDTLDWHYLSENPNALNLLEANPNKINWTILSFNPNAIHMLKLHPEKINWNCLSANPSIFEIDPNQTKIYIIEKANILDNLLYKN